MSKRHTAADPTANAAIGNTKSNSVASDLQRRQMLREQVDAARNERLRRLREQQAEAEDGEDR